MRLFDKNENAFTATAQNLVETPGQQLSVDFTKWGMPDRVKINQALVLANLYAYKQRGSL